MQVMKFITLKKVIFMITIVVCLINCKSTVSSM